MSATDPRPDLYISADVETDGPVPGPFSMLSFGLAVVGRYDGRRFDRLPSRERTFYRELRPISENYEDAALAVNGLSRERLKLEGTSPEQAIEEAVDWVRSESNGLRPVLVAYPVAFDWSFLYWYFQQFSKDGSPFGHSSCLDIRTLYQAVTGAVFDRSGKAAMPRELLPSAPHTHNALDDAVEQGELFANLMEIVSRRPPGRVGERSEYEYREPSWLAQHVLAIA